jgi:hypothetical protein
MLDRHEEEALAEIEARLHAEDPDLGEALDAGVAPLHVHPLVRSLAMLVGALTLTTVTTLWLGPDLGALVAVLTLSYAFLYGWQALRVCRGLRPPD